MCGIVGYVGDEQAAPILLMGLSKLEYRGYDSAGIAVRNEVTDKIAIVKARTPENSGGEDGRRFCCAGVPAVLDIPAGQLTGSLLRPMPILTAQMTDLWFLFIMELLRTIRN